MTYLSILPVELQIELEYHTSGKRWLDFLERLFCNYSIANRLKIIMYNNNNGYKELAQNLNIILQNYRLKSYIKVDGYHINNNQFVNKCIYLLPNFSDVIRYNDLNNLVNDILNLFIKTEIISDNEKIPSNFIAPFHSTTMIVKQEINALLWRNNFKQRIKIDYMHNKIDIITVNESADKII